ncbi:MAG: RNA polymerase sigma factor [Ignavibacteriaceae bacterium]|nr:RNA polymerase sigma factor [Ignavibacteriaceae bacterium]
MAENSQDFELIKNFLDGDESSFNRLLKKYQEKIYWQARRMAGNHVDADEIVQEVLLVMYNKLNTFKFESSLYSWIYRITATRSINYIKKRDIKKIFSLDALINKKDDKKSFETNIEEEEQLNLIKKKLQMIPPKQREVFIMRSFDDLSYDEIAEITGKSVGALKANYFHALNKLKEIIKNEK